MKTTILAAVAAVGFASAASADDFDNTLLTTTVTTGNLEFSVSSGVDRNLEGLGDDWVAGAKATVLSYGLGEGTSDVKLYGQFGEVAEDEFGVLGAQYVWTTVDEGSTLELTADAAYVMFDDFENGDLVLTPSAELTAALDNQIAVFGGVGYSWDATNDFAQLGGYVEAGADIALTDTVSVRPSVVQPFDTANDDAYAAIELKLNF